MTTRLRLRTDQIVSYLDQGTGSPLILIHGVGMQHQAWSPQIEAFSQTHRVIAIDLPGHGESTPLEKGSELPDFVQWLHDFIIALNCGPANIAGHSMGALIAGGYVSEHPESVNRVALLNGVYKRTETAQKAVLTRADEIANGGIDLKGPLARWFTESPTDLIAKEKTERWLSQMNQQSYAITYRAFARGDATYTDSWEKVKCPALFLTGDGDPNSTPEMSRTMAEQAPRGHLCIIKGHKHMANLTAADTVNDALTDWLNQPVCHHRSS
ncbi:hypothetical protein WH96_11410 [Kiloniella spongiae]|uniref:AB hydrolase-1 domain-containing protein n=1 Tax=Kiloniella spongiae TaxID=1489064 RepID=A0A0H2MDX4_9PROT|nr:hypothetical protein WH96_11410 [Kiloniella spongiae]